MTAQATAQAFAVFHSSVKVSHWVNEKSRMAGGSSSRVTALKLSAESLPCRSR